MMRIAALMRPEETDRLHIERENDAVRNRERSGGASSP